MGFARAQRTPLAMSLEYTKQCDDLDLSYHEGSYENK